MRSNARLVEVFQKTADGGRPYLFVHNEHGSPVGILAAEEILRRVSNPHPLELARWMNMPAEAALQSRIDVPNLCSKPISDQTQLTTVTHNGSLLGVVTDDDVLISWRSIQKTLTSSQGDAVTGLPNRAAFDFQLEAECNRARRCQHSVSVILVDLDYFKQINDENGHTAGDAALLTVGSTLRRTLRSYDMVARFGGDEFAVICNGCRPGEIDIVLRRIREEVLKVRHSSPDSPVPTISVGACTVHDLNTVRSATDLIEAADECLYAAKRVGRNCAFRSETRRGEPAELPVFVPDSFCNTSHIIAQLEPAETSC
ncbi:MAG: GGDEF domain-containing protein [Planctomycetaceae bacterium]